jgi:Holliday junction resolvase
MSLHRQNPKRDAVERDVIKTLEARGYAVFQISGTGVPDLLVSKLGSCWLVEVKRRLGKLTAAQEQFRSRWTGEAIRVVRSRDDALAFPKVGLDWR